MLGSVGTFFTVLSHVAAAQVIELDAGSSRGGLAEYVRYVQVTGATDATLGEVLAMPDSSFEPIDKPLIDFGPTSKTTWLRLSVRNASSRDGEWLLSFNMRFMKEVIVYRRERGTGRLLLEQTPASRFDERPVPFRLLTMPFALRGGEQSDLFIGYRSEGTTAMPLSIETPTSFAERYQREATINAVAYTSVAFLVLISLLQGLLFRQRSQLAYAAYLGATLAYIVHMDGYTFQYLWPNSPAWNSYAPIPLSALMSVAAVSFGRSFVETRVVAPTLDKIMVTLIACALVLSVAGLVVDELTLKGAAYVVATLSAGSCLVAAVLAHRRGRPALRFFLVGWLGVFGGVFMTSVLNNIPAVLSRAMVTMVPKATIMFDALMFFIALADRARAWRLERDAATRRELEALRAQQEVTAQLHRSEREKLEAMLAAQAKAQQLAMASHDIRQPLATLSLALKELAETRTPAAEAAKQSLEYLRDLADEYTDHTEENTASGGASTGGDSFALHDLLANINLMFREEARSKGLAFRCRTRAAQIRGDPMATMRLLSNLVANAIKYTPRGKVLVGCRQRRDSVTVVVADTGPGIPPDELARVLKERERGSNVGEIEGDGLGLAIATSLAERWGYGFECRSKPNRGTAFFVDLPRAPGA